MDWAVLILAEAGLELVDPTLWGEPEVVRDARRRGKRPGDVLLDISRHYRAVKRLREWWKRGRPDIVHVSLLLAQSSVLNRAGFLRTFVHTYRGLVIEVDPETRVPRNYMRFVGLMEQLLRVGRVPPSGKALMRVLGHGLPGLIGRLGVDKVFVLDEKGRPVDPVVLGRMIVEAERPAIVVGGFQRGSFGREVSALRGVRVSIAPFPLDAWWVTAKVLSEVEDALRLYGVLWRESTGESGEE